MLKLCIIAPEPHLQDFAAQGDMHLVLSHLLREEDIEVRGTYTHFYRHRSEMKIMDNGLFENGVAEPTEVLLKKAEWIRAYAIVAPDVLYNREETLRALESFKKQCKGYRVMGVPQADNPEDYIASYREVAPIVDIVGLSILAIPRSFSQLLRTDSLTATRQYAIYVLGWYADKDKWHHCLGLGDNMSELGLMSSTPWIRSCDSSSPVVHGARGIVYGPGGRIPGGKRLEKLDFGLSIEPNMHHHIHKNIEIMRRFIEEG